MTTQYAELNEVQNLFDPNRTYTVKSLLTSKEYNSLIEAVRKSEKRVSITSFVKQAILDKVKKTKPHKETGEWALYTKLKSIDP